VLLFAYVLNQSLKWYVLRPSVLTKMTCGGFAAQAAAAVAKGDRIVFGMKIGFKQ
jgi:hypothetical protein